MFNLVLDNQLEKEPLQSTYEHPVVQNYRRQLLEEMDGDCKSSRVSVMTVEETEIINQILSKHGKATSMSVCCHAKVKVIEDDFEFGDDGDD